MTIFLRIIKEKNKLDKLKEICKSFRNNKVHTLIFNVELNLFNKIPGKALAYWVSSNIYDRYESLNQFENNNKVAKVGIQSGNNSRFVRLYWELKPTPNKSWVYLAKGGPYSKFYSDLYFI